MSKAKELDIDFICNQIIEEKTYRQIAEHHGISQRTLQIFLADEKHSARAREAFKMSADSYADKAEKVLLDLKKDATPAEMMQARELHQYYKWKSAKRHPQRYSDKMDITTGGDKITTPAPVIIHAATGEVIKLARSEGDIDKDKDPKYKNESGVSPVEKVD